MALAPISAIMTVIQPWMLQLTIDEGISASNVDAIHSYSLGYLAAVLVGFATTSAYTLFTVYAATKTIAHIRHDLYVHTLTRSQRFLDQEPSGKLLTRATSDVEALGETLSMGAITIVLDIMLVIGISGLMFNLSWYLALLMILTAPPLVIAVNITRKRLRTLFQQVRTSLSHLTAFTAERLNGLTIVQLYRDENRALTEYDKRLSVYRSATVKTNIYDAALYACLDALRTITIAGLLWFGAKEIGTGLFTVGLLAAFIDCVSRLYRPIQEFSAKVATIQRASSALEKIFGLLDVEETVPEGYSTPAPLRGELCFHDVRFAYNEDTPEVLRGITFTLKPGSVLALVGRTGSGKSTIGKLLTRAYAGYTGSITLDGVELRDLPKDYVRGAIGSVRQDVQMFPGDVRLNTSLGADIDDETLLKAIDVANATQIIDRLGGLDATIAHRAANLSVGEAQLLSFARTIAIDPPIVVLDEATASVDSITEASIQSATEHLLREKTVLVIAHRLSTVRHADLILHLRAGEIIESGTHDELVAANGPYAALFDYASSPA
jgi:ATP-binding cassette subfamily B protein